MVAASSSGRLVAKAYQRVPMKKSPDLSFAHDRATELPKESAADMASLDWRAIAGQRLQRAIEFEQELVRTGKRLAGLQQDYLELMATAETRLRKIAALEQCRVSLDEQLRDAVAQQESIRSSFLQSRSWRITRPLRALARRYASLKAGWRR